MRFVVIRLSDRCVAYFWLDSQFFCTKVHNHYCRTLSYYDCESTFILRPVDCKKSPIFLPAYSVREEAGTIPGGFEVHFEKTDWGSAGRRGLSLRFRNSIDRSAFFEAVVSAGCVVRLGLSPVSRLHALNGLLPVSIEEASRGDAGTSLQTLQRQVRGAAGIC